MCVDLIKFNYIGTMRAYDGSTFRVAWVTVPDDTPVLDLGTPFRSGRNDPFSPFDTGAVGEIPELYPERSRVQLPSRVCHDCRVGDDEWWEDGWPAGTPPVVLAPDGFATGCSGGIMPVLSVGLALPTLEFVISGSPVTHIGTLTGDWHPQLPNLVFASPAVAGGIPHFRPLVLADLPPLPPFTVPVPLIQIPPDDATQDLILRQHSSSHAANLQETQTSAGVAFGATITGDGHFSDAGPTTLTGALNERFGVESLASMVYCFANTAFGHQTLRSLVTGSGNNGSGYAVLKSLVSGYSNNGQGSAALKKLTSGNNNHANGAVSLYNLVSGNSNTADGYSALYRLTGGDFNTALGAVAGYTLTHGDRNTFVGRYSRPLGPTDSDEIVVGCNLVGHGSGTNTLGPATSDSFVGSAVLPAVNAINLFLGSPSSGAPGPLTPRHLATGDISVGILPPGYPWSFIVGAPPSGASNLVTLFKATNSIVFVDAFTMNNADGLHGSVTVWNNGANQAQIQIVTTDAFGVVQTGSSANIFPGNKGLMIDFDTGGAIGAFGGLGPFQVPPFVHVVIQLRDPSGGGVTVQLQAKVGLVGGGTAV
jgi:hypothetical protein